MTRTLQPGFIITVKSQGLWSFPEQRSFRTKFCFFLSVNVFLHVKKKDVHNTGHPPPPTRVSAVGWKTDASLFRVAFNKLIWEHTGSGTGSFHHQRKLENQIRITGSSCWVPEAERGHIWGGSRRTRRWSFYWPTRADHGLHMLSFREVIKLVA